MTTTTPLSTYLGNLRLIQGSGIASDERSYYPALDALLRASGDELAPKVVPIHDVADRGAGHPDYVLQVETTRDTRAAVEVKPAGYDLATLLHSEQVRRYLDYYGLCLLTNLREFALVERAPHGAATPPVPLMRYALAEDDHAFWTTPPEALARQHADGLRDFLVSVLTWQATITRPKTSPRRWRAMPARRAAGWSASPSPTWHPCAPGWPKPYAFTIGGYPVLKKWLDYRHIGRLGRPLLPDEVRYVAEMDQRIAALLPLGPSLDANYAAVKARTLVVGVA